MKKPVTDSRLLDVLASLNEIGATVNQFGQDGEVSVDSTLNLIVESAIRVVPGASAVIFAFDSTAGKFIASSRVSAGSTELNGGGDEPRPDGLGYRAIRQRRRVLSYEENDISIHPVRTTSGARVMGCFPLVVASSPVGALYVYLPEERHLPARAFNAR